MSDLGGAFDSELKCRPCWNKGTYAQKQRDTPKHASTGSIGSKTYNPKFATLGGGGGNPCAKCNKTAYSGEALSYEGKIYHPDCLTCADCGKKCDVGALGGSFDGATVCKPCWSKGGYSAKQRDTGRTSLPGGATKTYNSKFATLGGGGGTPCVKCSKTAYSGEAVSYNGSIYHAECLACGDCNKQLPIPEIGGAFEGKVCCRPCWTKGGYAAKQRDSRGTSAAATPTGASVNSRFAHLGGGGGMPCAKCSKTVYSGEALSYESKIYHPDCLTCADCGKKCDIISLGGAYENQTVCKPCWTKGGYAQKQRDAGTKTFPGAKPSVASKFANLGGGGNKCFVCEKTVYPAETIQFNQHPYHANCFACCNCGTGIQQLSQAEGKGDKVYCGKCFQTLGLWRADA